MFRTRKLTLETSEDQSWASWAFFGISVLTALFVVSRYNFLLFHGLAELFSIAVAWALAMLVWNTRRIIHNDALVFIAIAYFFIGFVDLIHTLAYKGMGVFDDKWGANLPTQLWIAARYMESISLMLFPLLLGKRVRPLLTLGIFTGTTIIVFCSIFIWTIFPVCYVEGMGLTTFKKFSEYIICLMLAAGIVLLFRKRTHLNPEAFWLMTSAMIITILGELAFTFYASVYGLSNIVGHFFKIISFFLIYTALVRSSLTKPYSNLFLELEKEKEALKESEERYRILVDFLPLPVLLTQNEEIVFNNPSAVRLFGVKDKSELIGSSPNQWIHPDYAEQAFLRRNRLQEPGGRAEPVELRLITQDGRNVFVLANAASIIHKSKTALLSVFQDITATKQAENALRESEKRYRDIASVHAGMIWEVDENFSVTHLSGRVCEILGYEQDEIIGKNPLFLVDPKDRERVGFVMSRLSQEREPIKNIEYWCRNKDGRRVRILTNGISFFSPNGRFLGSRGTHLDVTETYWARRRRDLILRVHDLSQESDSAISALISEACAELTDSPMSFFGMLEPDESAMIAHVWSPQAMAECRIPDKPLRFPIETAGLWAEPIRRREPLIYNDYSLVPEKRGLPDGHVVITRYLGVPIIEGDKVIAVAGVANRPAEYDETHIMRLRLTISIVSDFLATRSKEKALIKSEEAHRALVEGLPDVIMRFDREGRHLFVSDNVREEVDIEAAQFIGKTHAELGFPEAQCRFWEESIQRVFDTGAPLETEFTLKGYKLWPTVHNWRIVPERDAHGNVSSVLSISRDITAHRQAEHEYKTLFSEMLDGFAVHEIICDMEGSPVDYRFLAVNPAFERMTGLKAESIVGRNVMEVLPGTERHWIETYGKVALSGEPISFESYSAEIGKHFEVTAYRPLPGQFACIFQDITESKRAEEALRESEERFRGIFKTSPTGIAIVDTSNQQFLQANESFLKIVGYSIEELKKLKVDDITVPDDWEIERDLITDYLNSHVSKYELVKRYKRKDGEIRHVQISGDILQRHDGEQPLAVANVLDITDRINAEKEKDQLQDQLQQAQKMEAIGTLAGGISHDFNNLLQAINGYAQLLLMEKSDNDPEYNSLKAIQDAGIRASGLVRQLLLFSRKVDSAKRPLELQYQVEQAKKMLERTIPKMVEIQVNMGNRLWTINADPIQMEQMLLNLGTNAADAMPDGGRLLFDIKNASLEDDFLVENPGAEHSRYVLLTVSDTGCGMDNATLEKIFDPFFTTKEIGKGTGLGLASVYGIVKSHDGYINCISEVGQGTTFKIYLPAIVQPEVEETRDVELEPIPSGAETILLVDDEKAIRGFAQQALMKFGYNVITASTGEEALEFYSDKSKEIDLIVMDIGMPGMGGHKCLMELLKLNPEVKVVIASGYSMEKKSIESGANGFVGKPYQLTDLLNTVRTVLDKEAGS